MISSLASPREEAVAECTLWLHTAQKRFKLKNFFFFHSYSSYDLIWQALHQIRHIFCRVSPPTDLLSVVVDIRGCLSYIREQNTRSRSENELLDCEESLRKIVADHTTVDIFSDLSLGKIRYSLEQLSRLTADEQDVQWRKVNLLRTRLMVTSFISGGLLLWLLFLVPALFPKPEVNIEIVLAIVLFGALGGLVSALSTMEPLKSPPSDYYISRILLGLKPVVGAAAGLILYLLQLSKVVILFSASTNPTATYLTTAFFAGFSERFFMGQLEKVVGVARETEKKRNDH